MKRMIIVGAGSYIGLRLEKWLARWPRQYAVRRLSMRAPGWQDNIGDCDVVVQAAGIAHRGKGETDASLYYKVNRDMAYEAAKLAKASGAGQFIFLSSMSVYGRVTGHIDGDTPLAPNTHYGRSKLAAEALLGALSGDGFHVAVLRPPMVFGPGCKGNYPRLSRLAVKVNCFPAFEGERSMLYVDHLCEAIRQIADEGGGGCYFPQDRDYYNVPRLMACIARCHERTMHLMPGLGPIMALLARCGGGLGKVLGSLTYDRALPGAPGPYQIYDNQEAVRLAETEEDT